MSNAAESGHVLLRNGTRLPSVGLGVFRAARGRETQAAVRQALRLGYRHIDTARVYGNETDVGQALADSEVPRDQVFVTTKLWNQDQGFDSALKAFDQSQKALGLEVVDLYLLHWPVPQLRLESWRALERLQSEGRVREIGVSNFLVPHLEELLGHAKTPPAVNQIEVHPFLQRRAVRALCKRQGIAVEAYSPLTKGQKLSHPVLGQVAAAIRRSPAQVLLRWGLQSDLVVLPKSVRAERIAENLALFDFSLDAAQMAKLDGLEEGLATAWDPEHQR